MILASEISNAILEGKAWFELNDGTEISLPTTQASGTDYQKKSHAYLMAIEIVESLSNTR